MDKRKSLHKRKLICANYSSIAAGCLVSNYRHFRQTQVKIQTFRNIEHPSILVLCQIIASGSFVLLKGYGHLFVPLTIYIALSKAIKGAKVKPLFRKHEMTT